MIENKTYTIHDDNSSNFGGVGGGRVSDSFVRGFHPGDGSSNLVDDSICSSFHPLAISTSTKSGKETAMENNRYPSNFHQSFHTLATTETDDSRGGDTSSLGLLKSSNFKSDDTLNNLGDNENGESKSIGWNVVSPTNRRGMENFSDEFEGNGLDNDEFFAMEEARNQADHPFIQEEVIKNSSDRYDTTAWTVNDRGDCTPKFMTSDQSNISVSSLFKRRSGCLGQLDGTMLPSEERPNFGSTIIERKTRGSVATESASDAGAASATKNSLPSNQSVGASIQDSIASSQHKSQFDTVLAAPPRSNRPHRHRQTHVDENSDPKARNDRLAVKPPKPPTKLHDSPSSVLVESPMKNSTVNESAMFNNTTASAGVSFLSVTKIQGLIGGMGDMDASMLARTIVAQTSADMAAKRELKKGNSTKPVAPARNAKSVSPPMRGEHIVEASSIGAAPSPEKHRQRPHSMDADYQPRETEETIGAEAAKSSEKKGAQSSESSSTFPALDQSQPPRGNDFDNIRDASFAPSIPVVMKINGITYKGTLYAQQDDSD